EILRMAREDCCGLIVMGTRERRGLGRLFGRSISAQVRWNSPCPVATVKLPPGWLVDRPRRRRRHESGNRNQSERRDEPGATGSHRATGAAPTEWELARLPSDTGARRPHPAGPCPDVLCEAARATRGHGRDGPPDHAE